MGEIEEEKKQESQMESSENSSTSEQIRSIKEERIRKITQLYYSRKDIQKAIFSFSSNREIAPSYMMESFGTRPDSFQYPGDIFEMVKKGTTSFHCSEELWTDPLKISTGMNEKQANELRSGWDFLIDIDSKYLDYSKIMAELVIKVLNFHGVRNFGLKFSGSKGFHFIIPWKAFPQSIHNNKTSDMFPEWPRIITKYIMETIKKELIEKITEMTKPNKYVKDFQAPKEVIPDLILVSPRHLFRMPYSLHEKTSLASIVLKPEELHDFQPKDADPFKAEIRDFMPNSKPGEASELLREALDWYKTQHPESESQGEKKSRDFKPIALKEISEKNFPPSIAKILQGIKGDGRKRALFIILNFFRSIGMDRKDVEKALYDWNKKNELPLKEGYVKSQLISSYRGKPVPPPNYDKDYYKGIGIIPTEEEIRYKNPASYMVRKTLMQQGAKENKDGFKSKKGRNRD
ncbi:MAG: DNA primase small subunit domain-containing protein [Nanoarchaeota archaeon]